MKNTLFLLTALALFSCQNKQAERTEETTNNTKDAFHAEMDSLYATGVFNGYTATIVDSTGTIYNQGFGFADINTKKKYTENTLINIASISKVFIGVALLKAQELNFLNLDDPINKYLPFEVVNPNFPKDTISIRQLATHTSAIVDSDIYMESCYVNKDNIPIAEHLKEKYGSYYQNPSNSWLPLADYLSNLLQEEGKFYSPTTFANRKAGEVHEYSNVGAALCALVIESATKKSFHEFTAEHIFKPLKMSSTAWFFEEVDSSRYSKLYFDQEELPYYKILSYPDGGLITSSTDLGIFLAELIKGYSGNGSLLSPDSYQEMFKSQLAEETFEGKENFNVGIFLEKELAYQVIGHSGGDPGTNTLMFFDTETKVGKIFITNSDSKKQNSNEVMWGIWNALDHYEK